ncbi:hypothetical protein BKA03_001813 [Demequina lutea]|uniref:Uncharacterized protein n=1 Tax=Demequina lutea TaxID=431489 RepID=A0A7Y9ZA90_9MICO|nr:hypothetical protein [Demequina lutea]
MPSGKLATGNWLMMLLSSKQNGWVTEVRSDSSR